jgi:hypothetical protein
MPTCHLHGRPSLDMHTVHIFLPAGDINVLCSTSRHTGFSWTICVSSVPPPHTLPTHPRIGPCIFNLRVPRLPSSLGGFQYEPFNLTATVLASLDVPKPASDLRSATSLTSNFPGRVRRASCETEAPECGQLEVADRQVVWEGTVKSISTHHNITIHPADGGT